MKHFTTHIQLIIQHVDSPYLRQHCLGETGMHEDLYDLSATDEAVIVCVRLPEHFIISLPVSHRYHPVHHWLE